MNECTRKTERVIIFDNRPFACIGGWEIDRRVAVVTQSRWIGTCEAFLFGLRALNEQVYEAALLLDHDSTMRPDALEKLLYASGLCPDGVIFSANTNRNRAGWGTMPGGVFFF